MFWPANGCPSNGFDEHFLAKELMTAKQNVAPRNDLPVKGSIIGKLYYSDYLKSKRVTNCLELIRVVAAVEFVS